MISIGIEMKNYPGTVSITSSESLDASCQITIM